MKVLSGVYPHGSYDGQIFFDGTERKFGSIADSENTGVIIIHQELALVPLLSIAENIFLGHETAKGGIIDWFEAFRQTPFEAVKVVIVRKSPALTELDVRAYCEQNLTGYKRPKVVEFRDALPKTPVGKVLRRALRSQP